jgi:hypothetical protein
MNARPVWHWLWRGAIVAGACVVIAHGCHGDDIDHEPGILWFDHDDPTEHPK